MTRRPRVPQHLSSPARKLYVEITRLFGTAEHDREMPALVAWDRA